MKLFICLSVQLLHIIVYWALYWRSKVYQQAWRLKLLYIFVFQYYCAMSSRGGTFEETHYFFSLKSKGYCSKCRSVKPQEKQMLHIAIKKVADRPLQYCHEV